ncbi:hypothetical protein [Pseudomonas sp. NFACC08-1]|uniref:hypothetical protein n=1 Tax=Pseudomonas sp. NFACC08-1 TaxID=1566238 RepID=UPI00211499E4|nr:hypothetical protein [Pseudomonas sp. NFACC08-1]
MEHLTVGRTRGVLENRRHKGYDFRVRRSVQGNFDAPQSLVNRRMHRFAWHVRYKNTASSVMYRLTLDPMGNWQIIFRFIGSDIELVDYLDYH